jgi:hypothetical protein
VRIATLSIILAAIVFEAWLVTAALPSRDLYAFGGRPTPANWSARALPGG